MNASRPSTARKNTPRTEKARNATLDTGIKITYEGKEYVVRMGDLSALHAQALRKELGISFLGLLSALESDADIDLVAGVIWLAAIVRGDTISYAEVAAGMGYSSLDTLKVDRGVHAEDVDANPEG